MNSRRIVLVLLVLLLSIEMSAQDPPQKQAAALIDRARQLSDIRAPNAKPFQIKATFSFIGEDLENLQGTYTEYWVSESQWRRETVVGDKKRIEGGASNKTWLLESNTQFPEQGLRVSGIIDPFPAKSAEFESVVPATPQSQDTKCAITKPGGTYRVKSAFCFDLKNGVLIQTITPKIIGERPADFSCQYGSFKKFLDHWFPREMTCVLNGHRQLEIKIVELSAEMPRDIALFAQPDGASEIGRCSGSLVYPKAISTPDPSFPGKVQDRNGTVFLSTIVDTAGKPQNVRVSKSGGKSFDDEAVRAVQKWKFKPGTCDGSVLPMQISIEVKFRLSR